MKMKVEMNMQHIADTVHMLLALYQAVVIEKLGSDGGRYTRFPITWNIISVKLESYK